MKVAVDYDLCAGHGQCLLAAPTVFDLEDDKDQVTILNETPGEDVRAGVVRAVSMCPVSAISVEG